MAESFLEMCRVWRSVSVEVAEVPVSVGPDKTVTLEVQYIAIAQCTSIGGEPNTGDPDRLNQRLRICQVKRIIEDESELESGPLQVSRDSSLQPLESEAAERDGRGNILFMAWGAPTDRRFMCVALVPGHGSNDRLCAATVGVDGSRGAFELFYTLEMTDNPTRIHKIYHALIRVRHKGTLYWLNKNDATFDEKRSALPTDGGEDNECCFLSPNEARLYLWNVESFDDRTCGGGCISMRLTTDDNQVLAPAEEEGACPFVLQPRLTTGHIHVFHAKPGQF